LNAKNYKPRKLSANEEKVFSIVSPIKPDGKTNRRSISKFDQYDPFIQLKNAAKLAEIKSSNLKNKFDANNNLNHNAGKKRNKAYSINENYSYNNNLLNYNSVPLNKDYDVFSKPSK
jgi:hypothetical protein